MNRREARRQAFLLLFQYKFQPGESERLLEDFFAENKAGAQRGYIESVVRGSVEHVGELDEIIEGYLKDWKIDRISSVSIAALRLGAYEILHFDDIPAAVSVNEAVALAKEFEGEEAASFVNGVLGKFKNDTEKSKS